MSGQKGLDGRCIPAIGRRVLPPGKRGGLLHRERAWQLFRVEISFIGSLPGRR